MNVSQNGRHISFADKCRVFITKHSEIWKFIKFTFTGASTSVLEMAVFAVLQYGVFKSLNTVPVTDNGVLSFLGIEYEGCMYSYFISAVIGYAAAYIMNRKLTFKADANPVFSTVIYTIWWCLPLRLIPGSARFWAH